MSSVVICERGDQVTLVQPRQCTQMNLERIDGRKMLSSEFILPKRPMNAVSTKEASGSAAKASDAGTAMRSTSDPRSSSLKTLLSYRIVCGKFVSTFKHDLSSNGTVTMQLRASKCT